LEQKIIISDCIFSDEWADVLDNHKAKVEDYASFVQEKWADDLKSINSLKNFAIEVQVVVLEERNDENFDAGLMVDVIGDGVNEEISNVVDVILNHITTPDVMIEMFLSKISSR